MKTITRFLIEEHLLVAENILVVYIRVNTCNNHFPHQDAYFINHFRTEVIVRFRYSLSN